MEASQVSADGRMDQQMQSIHRTWCQQAYNGKNSHTYYCGDGSGICQTLREKHCGSTSTADNDPCIHRSEKTTVIARGRNKAGVGSPYFVDRI